MQTDALFILNPDVSALHLNKIVWHSFDLIGELTN